MSRPSVNPSFRQQQQQVWRPRQICDPALGTRIRVVDDTLAEIQKLLSSYSAVDLTMVRLDSLGRPVPRLGADGRPVYRTHRVNVPGKGVETRSRPEYEEDVFVDRYPLETPNGVVYRNIDQDIRDAEKAVQDILTIACMSRDDMLKAPSFDAIRVLDKPLFSGMEFERLKMNTPTTLEPQLQARLTVVANTIKSTLDNQLKAFYDRLGDERTRRANLSSTTVPVPTSVEQKQTMGGALSQTPATIPRTVIPGGVPPPKTSSVAVGGAVAKRRQSRTLGVVGAPGSSVAAGSSGGTAAPQTLPFEAPAMQQQQPHPDARSIIPPPSPFSIPARLPSTTRLSTKGLAGVTPSSQQPSQRPTPASAKETPPPTGSLATKPNVLTPPVPVGAVKRRVSRSLAISPAPSGPVQTRPQAMVDTHISEPPSPSLGVGGPASQQQQPSAPSATLVQQPVPPKPATVSQDITAPSLQQQQKLQPAAITSTESVRRRPAPRRSRVIEEEEEEEGPANKPAQVSPPLPEHEAKRAKIELPPVIQPAVPFPTVPVSSGAKPLSRQLPSGSVSNGGGPSTSASSSPMMVATPDSLVGAPMSIVENDIKEEVNKNKSSATSQQSASPPHKQQSPSAGSLLKSSSGSSIISDSAYDEESEDEQSSQGGDSVIGSDSKFDIEVSEVEYSVDQMDADIQHLVHKLQNIQMESRVSKDPSIFTPSIDRLNQKINALTKFLSDQQQSGHDLFSVYFWRVLHDSTHTTLNESGPFLTEMEAKEDANMFLREYEMRRDGINRGVFVKAAQPLAQQVYRTACTTPGADLQASVVSVRVPEATSASTSTAAPVSSRLCIALALPWTRELFNNVFHDPYTIYLKRFFPGSDDTVETRRQFIAFYSPAIIYAWSNAFSDITLAETLIHPVYSENILSPDTDVDTMNCFGVTVAMYIFDSVERPGEIALAREFADSLQRILSVRSTMDVVEKLEHVLQQATKLQEQTIPDSSVSLMPDVDDPISITVTIQCYETENRPSELSSNKLGDASITSPQPVSNAALHCDRYVNDLYRLIYANGLRINAVESAVVYPNGDYFKFVDLLRKEDDIE